MMMATVFHELPSAIKNATVYFAAIDTKSSTDNIESSAIIMMMIVIDTESSTVSVANNKALAAGNDSPATVMVTTQVYSSLSQSLFKLLNNYVTFSAVSIPTQLLLKGLFGPCYTCRCFIFGGSLGAPKGFPACVTTISDIAP